MQTNPKPPIPEAARNFESLPDSASVTVKTVAVLFDVTPKTIWCWSKANRIPQPDKVGPNSTRWNVGKLRRHMASTQEAA